MFVLLLLKDPRHSPRKLRCENKVLSAKNFVSNIVTRMLPVLYLQAEDKATAMQQSDLLPPPVISSPFMKLVVQAGFYIETMHMETLSESSRIRTV